MIPPERWLQCLTRFNTFFTNCLTEPIPWCREKGAPISVRVQMRETLARPRLPNAEPWRQDSNPGEGLPAPPPKNKGLVAQPRSDGISSRQEKDASSFVPGRKKEGRVRFRVGCGSGGRKRRKGRRPRPSHPRHVRRWGWRVRTVEKVPRASGPRGIYRGVSWAVGCVCFCFVFLQQRAGLVGLGWRDVETQGA